MDGDLKPSADEAFASARPAPMASKDAPPDISLHQAPRRRALGWIDRGLIAVLAIAAISVGAILGGARHVSTIRATVEHGRIAQISKQLLSDATLRAAAARLDQASSIGVSQLRDRLTIAAHPETRSITLLASHAERAQAIASASAVMAAFVQATEQRRAELAIELARERQARIDAETALITGSYTETTPGPWSATGLSRPYGPLSAIDAARLSALPRAPRRAELAAEFVRSREAESKAREALATLPEILVTRAASAGGGGYEMRWDLLIGALAIGGLAAAVALARFVGRIKTRLERTEDIADMLGAVAAAGPARILAADGGDDLPGLRRLYQECWAWPDRPLAEQARFLVSALAAQGGGRRPAGQVALVSTLRERDGASATALMIGLGVARLGLKTALIEADLRAPRLAKLLEEPDTVTLVGALDGDEIGDRLLNDPWERDLHYLPAGDSDRNAADLLATSRLSHVLRALRRRYDLVLVTAPPVLTHADARFVALNAERSILAVRRGAGRADLLDGVRQLAACGAPVAGVALTEKSAFL